MDFQDIFLKDAPPTKSNFLSRIFGIFNEEIVRIWANAEASPYRDLGRPTLYNKEDKNDFHTLDFLLQEKTTNNIYVTEMKCEIAYQNFKYLTLENPKQIERHESKPAFRKFIQTANDPDSYTIKVNKTSTTVNGAILIWGRVNAENKKDICTAKKLKDVLSVEQIIKELKAQNNTEYVHYIKNLQSWSNGLFTALID